MGSLAVPSIAAPSPTTWRNALGVVLLLLAACGGGGGGDGPSAPVDPPPPPPPTTFTICGTVSGLSGTGLVLLLRDDEELPIGGNGEFRFTTGYPTQTDSDIDFPFTRCAPDPTGQLVICETHGGGARVGLARFDTGGRSAALMPASFRSVAVLPLEDSAVLAVLAGP